MSPEEVTALIKLLSVSIPALIGAYRSIAGNVSGAATVEQLIADADSKWAQIAANADAAIEADKPAL